MILRPTLAPELTSSPLADAKTDEGRAKAVEILDKLAEKYPRSLAIRRICLELVSGMSFLPSAKPRLADLDPFLLHRTLLLLHTTTTGADFRSRATTYLTNALSKGIPSVFADIKSLYTDKEKCQIIGELVEAFRKGLEEKGNFGAEGTDGKLSVHPRDMY